MTVDSVCDTDVAAAPNLLLLLSHFYLPLKCRAFSVPSELAKPLSHTVDDPWKVTDTRETGFITFWFKLAFIRFLTCHNAVCYFALHCGFVYYMKWHPKCNYWNIFTTQNNHTRVTYEGHSVQVLRFTHQIPFDSVSVQEHSTQISLWLFANARLIAWYQTFN